MPTFTYGTPTPGATSADYEGLHDQKIVLRYGGFRIENGSLWVNRRLDDSFRYAEQEGRVLQIRDGDGKMLSVPIPVPQENTAQLYVNQVQLNLMVVKPLTHFDMRMSVRLKLKGLSVTSANAFSFTSDRTGFMRAIIALGFNWRLADRASDYHDPDYVLDRMEANCTSPLTIEQIVLGVIDPILQEAAEDARLVEGQTGVKNAWFQWDMSYGYLNPITDPVVLDQIWKEVEGHDDSEEAVEEPVEDEVDWEGLKTDIASAVSGEAESVLTGDPTSVPNPRFNEVYELILESEPGFKSGAGMLGRVKKTTLAALHEAIFKKEEEAAL